MPKPAPTDGPRVYRVGELNRRVRLRVERWGEVWVEGEISEVSSAVSGHVYFTLDDGAEPAQLRVVMFRGDARVSRAKLAKGHRIRIAGRFSLYEPRGAFQMIARLALPVGDGEKRAELERLKRALAKEGLFAPERKRALPTFPSLVGVVTSRRGAALHDIISVCDGRAPARLLLAHCQVQGAEAPASIEDALRRLGRVPGLAVIILARGGGAAEDLSAFNTERVARAVAGCPVPVVTGIGHEIDDTLADLAADVRAATPSNAAERVIPVQDALIAALAEQERRLARTLEVDLGRRRLRLERVQRRLGDPRRASAPLRQKLNALLRRAERAGPRLVPEARSRLVRLRERLVRLDPRARLSADARRLSELATRLRASTPAHRPALAAEQERLVGALKAQLAATRTRFQLLVARLEALSPLSVLARGYAIVFSQQSGRALTRAAAVSAGDRLRIRLHEGSLEAMVLNDTQGEPS